MKGGFKILVLFIIFLSIALVLFNIYGPSLSPRTTDSLSVSELDTLNDKLVDIPKYRTHIDANTEKVNLENGMVYVKTIFGEYNAIVGFTSNEEYEALVVDSGGLDISLKDALTGYYMNMENGQPSLLDKPVSEILSGHYITICGNNILRFAYYDSSFDALYSVNLNYDSTLDEDYCPPLTIPLYLKSSWKMHFIAKYNLMGVLCELDGDCTNDYLTIGPFPQGYKGTCTWNEMVSESQLTEGYFCMCK
jgi:hypothetical protein